ncbi:Unsaturated glucuronyl hydrolase [Rubripirellula obstinata]|uniref:Unsaturated glucuronyl hydrolase n=1 Tax=Rubripirellula obstinata TaxID=406547 RepID=A0A5B1CGS9_9BACT|nr:glycosyl hydrolase [Rubripirellula obstinata]KAA1259135.1 Unsaturated glucuronyl hydrolase [Rubripirellula obstinata]
MKIDDQITPVSLQKSLDHFWDLSASKIESIERDYDPSAGSPVFTVDGRYQTRGWTEWTQGFQYGSEILQFDACGDPEMLQRGRNNTLEKMAPHVTHFGVHDHGFNNVSTYGNLLRLMQEGRIEQNDWEQRFYEMALMASGAVQAKRWTTLPAANGPAENNNDAGYIYSFNGPHSLFADTIRSLRSLSVAHQLGHNLMEENDRKVNLLHRVIQHARTTAEFAVYYGEGRDAYDIPGRTAHESIFNLNDGQYRCPNSQQGYAPFSTWTRGLAWIMVGFPEQLQFLATLDDSELEPVGGRAAIESFMLKAAQATCDFYIDHSAADGIPYWDTGAPQLHRLGDGYLDRAADPYNEHEPVDSSAAAIGCQGLLRLGAYLGNRGDSDAAIKYTAAGLTILRTLLDEPYLSTDDSHQGLILHSIYHRPGGWDNIPAGQKIPCGESSMWGDYHIREAALYVQRMAKGEAEHTFYLA